MFQGHLVELLKQIAVDMKICGGVSIELQVYTLGKAQALSNTEWLLPDLTKVPDFKKYCFTLVMYFDLVNLFVI